MSHDYDTSKKVKLVKLAFVQKVDLIWFGDKSKLFKISSFKFI